MSKPIKQSLISSHIRNDFVREFSQLIKDGKLGIYQNFIETELSKKKLVIVNLFDRATEDLEGLTERPNIALARFFLVLSSLRDISKDIYDWSIDAMTYAENDDDFPVPSDKTELFSRYYQIIRPTLEKAGM